MLLSKLFHELKTAILTLFFLTVLLGIIYPLAVTGMGQLLFKAKANGSLIYNSQHEVIGSRLIGQYFNQSQYFSGRPSATTPTPYNAASSAGSNLGPTNPDLIKTINDRVDALQATNGKDAPIPVDLVTASASGLDPDISVASALYQAPRIAAARHLPLAQVNALIQSHIQKRELGFLGEPRVNVLELNLALDHYAVDAHSK